MMPHTHRTSAISPLPRETAKTRPDAARLVAIDAAVNDLPALMGEIFLLCRDDDLSFAEIAGRLSIDALAVQACLAEALAMVATVMDGEKPSRSQNANIEPAERALRQRHRAYCEQALRIRGRREIIAWGDAEDDDLLVRQAVLATMPVQVREAFLLNRLEGLSYADIARRQRTFKWIVRRRMLRAIRAIAQSPLSYADWLKEQGRRLTTPSAIQHDHPATVPSKP
ncbi:sigma factor-like helix-turn-helix DNA-binding protein [Sphingobium sp. TB-6]|uniref:sigma factor-like helix-turn-helix DNA-binding protein n=1 Tax=Sphingobium sp. TB-6 TaxID=2728850 RepID=UPI0009E809F7|nr:sigma factor-like helix-turn-helix DNA-binding protein [Sphingobium sp. TB-6]